MQAGWRDVNAAGCIALGLLQVVEPAGPGCLQEACQRARLLSTMTARVDLKCMQSGLRAGVLLEETVSASSAARRLSPWPHAVGPPAGVHGHGVCVVDIAVAATSRDSNGEQLQLTASVVSINVVSWRCGLAHGHASDTGNALVEVPRHSRCVTSAIISSQFYGIAAKRMLCRPHRIRMNALISGTTLALPG